jgi:DNA-binding PucR family transcriptional regulator
MANDGMELHLWLDALAEISRAVNRALPLGDILNLIAGTTCHLTGYSFCAVFLKDPHTNALLISGSYGLSKSYVEQVNRRKLVPLHPGGTGEGPSSRAFRSRRPVTMSEVQLDPTWHWESLSMEQGYRSILSVPLIASGSPLGVLNCYLAETHVFAPGEVLLMETIANHAATAIEATNLRIQEQDRVAKLEKLTAELQHQRDELQNAADIQQGLMRLVLDGEGLTAIARGLAEVAECEVAIQDGDGHLLASSSTDNHSIELPSVPGDQTWILESATATSATPARMTIPSDRSGDDAYPGWLIPVVLDGEVEGRIWAFNPRQPFSASNLKALELGSVVTALELLRLRAGRERGWRISQDFFEDLLALDGRHSASLDARGGQIGVDPQKTHRVILVAIESSERGRKPAQPDPVRARASLRIVNRLAESLGESPLAVVRDDHVVLLRPEEIGSSTAVAYAEKLARGIRALSSRSATVVVGPVCESVVDVADTYRLCRAAVDLIQKAGRPGRVVTLDNLGVSRLLLQASRPADLIDFANHVLGPLEKYDEMRGSTLVSTLRTYVASGCSTVASAESLYVHSNTVLYRLRQIESLLGLDLRNPKTLLDIQLALTINAVLGHTV